MAIRKRERWMLIGAGVAVAGGVLAAVASVVSLPSAVPMLAGVLFLTGIVVIGIAGGLREAWDAVKALFP